MENTEIVSGKEIFKEILELKLNSRFVKYFLQHKLDTIDFPKHLSIKVATPKESDLWSVFFDKTRKFKKVTLIYPTGTGRGLITWEYNYIQERNLLIIRKTEGYSLTEKEIYYDDNGNVICEITPDEKFPTKPEIKKLENQN